MNVKETADYFARVDAFTNALYAAIAAAYQCELHAKTDSERAEWHAQGDAMRSQQKRAYAEAEARLSE